MVVLSMASRCLAELVQPLIENLLNNVKIRVGEGAYSWKMMATSPEGHSKFILDREANRRFMTQDTTEGGKKFTYQHRNDTLEIYATEFCPKMTGKGTLICKHPAALGVLTNFTL